MVRGGGGWHVLEMHDVVRRNIFRRRLSHRRKIRGSTKDNIAKTEPQCYGRTAKMINTKDLGGRGVAKRHHVDIRTSKSGHAGPSAVLQSGRSAVSQTNDLLIQASTG